MFYMVLFSNVHSITHMQVYKKKKQPFFQDLCQVKTISNGVKFTCSEALHISGSTDLEDLLDNERYLTAL